MKTKHFLTVIGIVAISLTIFSCAAVEALDCLQTGNCEEVCKNENNEIIDCSEIIVNEAIVETDSTLTVTKGPDLK